MVSPLRLTFLFTKLEILLAVFQVIDFIDINIPVTALNDPHQDGCFFYYRMLRKGDA